MGFNFNTIKLLMQSKANKVNFEKVITIGRQSLSYKFEETQILKEQYPEISNTFKHEKCYAESFLKALGAKLTDSMDVSDYEGANIIHDLNSPIPDDLRMKYSLVIDGGSLEHIFNFPTAMQNCMEMIEKNGFFIGITPTNNFSGHGFYQFSPELYYRIFDENNGFKVIKMYFYNQEGSKFFEVCDPHEVKNRVEIINSNPSLLFVIAQKTQIKSIFSKPIQQSDYQFISWETKSSDDKNKIRNTDLRGSLKTRIRKLLKSSIGHVNKKKSDVSIGNANPDYFKEIHLGSDVILK